MWDLRYLKSFRNSCWFWTFWHIRNFYSGDAHHAHYGKRSFDHHFQHYAHCAYEIYGICKVFEMAVCFSHFGLFEIATPLRSMMLTMANVVLIIISNITHTVHMRFTVFAKFSKCCLFFTFWLIRNCYPGDAHHANNGEHFSIPHFRYCTHWADDIYSVFTLFEIAVSFLHLG